MAAIEICVSQAQSLQSRSRPLDESRHILGGRRAYQCAHRPLLLDSSRSHHDYFVRQPPRLSEIVRYQQRRHRKIATHRIEGFLELASGDRIEGTEWLVEEDHAGASGNTARESHALTLAAGELVRKTIAEIRGR
jgi:hypothetical protein